MYLGVFQHVHVMCVKFTHLRLWQFCGSKVLIVRKVLVGTGLLSPRPWPSFCRVHSSLSFGVDRSALSLEFGVQRVNWCQLWRNMEQLDMEQPPLAAGVLFYAFAFSGSAWLLQGFNLGSFPTKLTSSYYDLFLSFSVSCFSLPVASRRECRDPWDCKILAFHRRE